MATIEAKTTLTPRQLEVARLIERGHSNVEIAAELGLSVRTVKAYTETIRHKLGVEYKRFIGPEMRDRGWA